MTDREKILRGAECCKGEPSANGCPKECPYLPKRHLTCGLDPFLDDVIALLKEQEPIKPTVAVDTWICSKCGHRLESQDLIDDKENPQVLVHEIYQYCPNCGKAVKWDDKW